MVQFFPCIALPALSVVFLPKYTGTSYWLMAAALYALTKLFEFYDHAIYSVGFILSGHTLNHFAAASACLLVLRYFESPAAVLIPVHPVRISFLPWLSYKAPRGALAE
jgi:hypothetical protein